MTAMRAVFRFDASPQMGGGHAYRCMTLARSLAARGWHCRFVINREAPETVAALRNDPAFTLGFADDVTPAPCDWLIVDHYGLDAGWEAPCRHWAGAILVIDDLADRRHDCDLLLDQTYGREAADYARLVPASCELLTGSAYALLRPDFARARTASLARRAQTGKLRRVLVSLGATDPENHSLEALKGIAESGLPVAVDVVAGGAARHLEALRAACAELPQQAQLHVDTTDMPALMATADIAIGAAGTSTWERCCLGLPSLMVVIAGNQHRTAEAVSAAGAGRYMPGPRANLSAQIAGALRELAGDPAALMGLSARAAALCDGRGADRLGLALVPAGRSKDGRAVALRLAAATDEDILLDWQRHPTTRRFARNAAVPSAEEHRRWFAARLADPDCLLTVITLDGAPAGMLRLDPLPPRTEKADEPGFEVSILVAPESRGLGVAPEALAFLHRWQATATIVAEVLPGNEASAALFRKAGYRPGNDGLLYSVPAEPALALSR